MMSNEEAGEVAKKYVGHRFVMAQSNSPKYQVGVACRIVGYEERCVVVEIEDELSRLNCPHVAGLCCHLLIPLHENNPGRRVWRIPFMALSPIKQTKPTIAFPNKCKICNSMCRKFDTFILCSNQKCKSRNGFKKYLKQFPKIPKIVPGATKENPIIVTCPKCDSSSVWYTSTTFITCRNCNDIKYNYVINNYYKVLYDTGACVLAQFIGHERPYWKLC